jgi:hypothetical protein
MVGALPEGVARHANERRARRLQPGSWRFN